jgi:hypothetical protein
MVSGLLQAGRFAFCAAAVQTYRQHEATHNDSSHMFPTVRIYSHLFLYIPSCSHYHLARVLAPSRGGDSCPAWRGVFRLPNGNIVTRGNHTPDGPHRTPKPIGIIPTKALQKRKPQQYLTKKKVRAGYSLLKPYLSRTKALSKPYE